MLLISCIKERVKRNKEEIPKKRNSMSMFKVFIHNTKYQIETKGEALQILYIVYQAISINIIVHDQLPLHSRSTILSKARIIDELILHYIHEHEGIKVHVKPTMVSFVTCADNSWPTVEQNLGQCQLFTGYGDV